METSLESNRSAHFSVNFEFIDSLGANYFFKNLLHPLVRKLFLHLKEATSHLQCENQCWTYQFLVAFEI